MFFPLKDENPTKSFAYVTVLLIAANCLVFLAMFVAGAAQGPRYRLFLSAKYGVIPFEIARAVDLNPKIAGGPYVTLVTSLFLHGSLWHLIGNMWFLWIFGNNIEDIVGHFKFVVFYLLGGIAASMLQILLTSSSTVPVIGASGAVSAVLGAYILKFPSARIRTLAFIFVFITVITVPAVAFIGIWFLMQLLFGLAVSASNVAWFAHIGGFVFGLLAVSLFQKREGYRRYKVY
jgi:membrane associated rhomboid family serine protease